ncbi:hypothetical protein LF95_03360 [Thalassospira sp. TSL5-1]|nr:hypothetical protein LF95_03360 [Thalassospira sp. TSL5-1]
MKIPEWVKPGIVGGIIGAIAISIVGFSANWVVSNSTAAEMATDQGDTAVIAALTPICVAQFKAQTPTNQTAQLAALEKESSYKRDDFVVDQGWATMPGSDTPTKEIADSCADELMKMVE